MDSATVTGVSADRAFAWLETLTAEIGPRRPTSRAERVASEWLRAELSRSGVAAELEEFAAHPTFALPQGAVLAAGIVPALVPRRLGWVRAALALAAPALGMLEDDPRLRPLSRALARRRSQNLVAVIEPAGDPRRTLCLVSHVDTSRSGLLFHREVAPRLRALLALASAALALQASEELIGRTAPGRAVVAAARGILVGGLALLAERELRGSDVPGANDNGSGVALTASLAAEIAERPLESTRVVLLVTGAEEAGTLGADAYVRAHETAGWLFLNFDGVCAPATLRYLGHEGVLRSWPADRALVGVVEELRERRPELGLERMEVPAGLTYDATPILARGGRALTISAQDGAIPNYHQPSDDLSNVDADTFGRALEIARELVAAVDRGDADRAGPARRSA
jgi:Peptidase family M28